jgi:hypothetical protein
MDFGGIIVLWFNLTVERDAGLLPITIVNELT